MATNFLEESLGKHLLMSDTYSKPSSLFIAFFNIMPNDAGSGGTEVTGVGYTRVSIVSSDANWDSPVAGDGVFKNSNSIAWPAPPGAGWGTVVGVGLYDHASAGNLLFSSTLASPIDFTLTPLMKSGDLTVTFSGVFSHFLVNEFGNHLFRTTAYSKPSYVYIALFSVMPDAYGDGGVEVFAAGYARYLALSSDENWTPPTAGSGSFSNKVNFDFNVPLASWGTVVGFGLYNSIIDGDYLGGEELSTPKVINIGNVANFVPGDLILTIN